MLHFHTFFWLFHNLAENQIMAVPRKERLSYIGKNLRYLRKQRGNTLEQMAEMLSLKGKSSYQAYEEDRALPDIHKIMKLASYYDLSVEELVYKDLESLGDVDTGKEIQLYPVEKIPVAARAGYAQGYGDIGYIRSLETINIPFKPYGPARAFEIDGDSMEPEISDGATVIGIKVSPAEVKNNKSYIVVTDDGVQCKGISFGEGDTVYLISRNLAHGIKHINKNDIREIWQVWQII